MFSGESMHLPCSLSIRTTKDLYKFKEQLDLLKFDTVFEFLRILPIKYMYTGVSRGCEGSARTPWV